MKQLIDYAIGNGYNEAQYDTLKQNIINIADAILCNIKTLHKTDTGMYYPTSEIINPNGMHHELDIYIIMQLKKIGVEFYDNNKEYRY